MNKRQKKKVGKRQSAKASALQKQYRQQVDRIRRLISRRKSWGFLGGEDIIPPRPKTITAGTIRRLKAITPEKIDERMRAVHPETGEIIPATRGRVIRRRLQVSARKLTPAPAPAPAPAQEADSAIIDAHEVAPDESFTKEQEPPDKSVWIDESEIYEQVVDNFFSMMSYINQEAQRLWARFLNNLIKDYGKEEVGRMLEACYNDGYSIEWLLNPSDQWRIADILERWEVLINHLDVPEGYKSDLYDTYIYEYAFN